MAGAIITDHFFCNAMRRRLPDNRYCILFFGTRENVEMAKFVFGSLLGEFERLWREHRRPRFFAHDRWPRSLAQSQD